MKVTATKLNHLTGYSLPTIRKRLQDLKPVAKEGRRIYFDSVAALSAIYAPELKQSPNANTDGRSRSDLDAELVAVKIQREKIKVSAMRGELIPADAVNRKWGKIAAAFQRQALAFPDRVAQLLETAPDYKSRVVVIKREMEALLNVLSRKRI